MNKQLKELLQEMQEKDLSTGSVLQIMRNLSEYAQARARFDYSDTPETEALARWSMDDAREGWRKALYNNDMTSREPDSLF